MHILGTIYRDYGMLLPISRREKGMGACSWEKYRVGRYGEPQVQELPNSCKELRGINVAVKS